MTASRLAIPFFKVNLFNHVCSIQASHDKKSIAAVPDDSTLRDQHR